MSLKRPAAGGESCKQDSFLCNRKDERSNEPITYENVAIPEIQIKKQENKLEIRHGRIRVQCLIFDYKAFGQFGVF